MSRLRPGEYGEPESVNETPPSVERQLSVTGSTVCVHECAHTTPGCSRSGVAPWKQRKRLEGVPVANCHVAPRSGERAIVCGSTSDAVLNCSTPQRMAMYAVPSASSSRSEI